MAATNLNEYYTQLGKKLPTLQERQGVATKAGIQGYRGTAEQNTQLLSYLQKTDGMAKVDPNPPAENTILKTNPVVDSIKTIKKNMSTKVEQPLPQIPQETPPTPTETQPTTPSVGPATTISPTEKTVTTEKATTVTPVAETIQTPPAQPTPTQPTQEKPAQPTEPVKTRAEIVQERIANRKLQKNLGAYRTGEDLYKAVNSGIMAEGTAEYNALAQANPDLINQYVTYKKDKAKKEQITTLGNVVLGNPTNITPTSNSEAFLNKIMSSFDEDIATTYKNIVTNDPNYIEAVNTANTLKTQLAEVNNNINKIGDDTRKLYTGEVPESVIASDIARRAKPLIQQAQFLQDQIEIADNEANRIMDENRDFFTMQVEDRRAKQNLAFQLYGTIRAEEIRQEDIMRADEELKMKMEQAKSEAEYNQYKDERDYNFKVAEAMQRAGQWEADYSLKAQEMDMKAKEFAQGNWSVKDNMLVDSKTGNTKPISQSVSYQGMQPSVVNSILDQCRATGQCGEGANDYLQKMGEGRLLGDSYGSKTDDINSYTPVLGSVAVWNPSGDNIGHAGIVLEDRGDKLLVRDWNYGLDEKQQVHEVSKSDITGTGGGYIVPTKIKEAQIPEVSRTVLQGIEELENHPGLNAAVGFGFQKLLPGNQGEEGFLPATDAEDFRVKFMSFRDNIVLPNLELLKGAMSDNDIKFIRSAGTAASLGMSEEAFKNELERIKQNIYKKFGIDKPTYTKQEEALIQELAQNGATDEEIDQALNQYRS